MKKKELSGAEFKEFYGTYLNTLPDDTVLMDQLEKGFENFPKFIRSIPEDKLKYAYAEGKWTIAQVLLHIIDSERVFQYRAFRFSRGDKTPLMGFEQDDYILDDDPRGRTHEDIVKAYQVVRASTIQLFENLDDTMLRRKGTASELQWSVAGLGFVICGHQRHHRNSIRERYL